eukprot:Opistho-2@7676
MAAVRDVPDGLASEFGAAAWGNPLDLFDFNFDPNVLQVALDQQKFEISELEPLSSFHGMSPKSEGTSTGLSFDSPLSLDSIDTILPGVVPMQVGEQSSSDDGSDGNDKSAADGSSHSAGSRRRAGRMDPETRRQSRVVREKKRQQNISNGYDEIKALVPGCSDYKISRATILQRCATYLVQVRKTLLRMQKDNEVLRLENAHLTGENAQLRALLDESTYGMLHPASAVASMHTFAPGRTCFPLVPAVATATPNPLRLRCLAPVSPGAVAGQPQVPMGPLSQSSVHPSCLDDLMLELEYSLGEGGVFTSASASESASAYESASASVGDDASLSAACASPSSAEASLMDSPSLPVRPTAGQGAAAVASRAMGAPPHAPAAAAAGRHKSRAINTQAEAIELGLPAGTRRPSSYADQQVLMVRAAVVLLCELCCGVLPCCRDLAMLALYFASYYFAHCARLCSSVLRPFVVFSATCWLFLCPPPPADVFSVVVALRILPYFSDGGTVQP